MQESVLIVSWCGAVSSAAHPREQDADVQAPMHFLHVRHRHALQAIWAGMWAKRGLCSWRIPLHNRPRGDRPLQLEEAGAEVFNYHTDVRLKRNLKR
jgi:hypothetical protein